MFTKEFIGKPRIKIVDEGMKVAEWEKLREKIGYLQSDIAPFKIDFLDRDNFKKFADNLFYEIKDFNEICITGYFSETVRNALEKIIRIGQSVKLICPEFSTRSKRDERNLQALEKLIDAGAEIKFNNRLHARFLVANITGIGGLLIIGSFDFNTECIGRERYDAGIKTRHPDLVRSAVELFEQIWNEAESIHLEEFIKKGKG